MVPDGDIIPRSRYGGVYYQHVLQNRKLTIKTINISVYSTFQRRGDKDKQK
jgi:hypothetical protein